MSIFDIIVVAIVAISALLGFFKGVLKSILRFVEIILIFGLSALAAFAMSWLGLTDFSAVGSGGDLMESGIIFAVAAFVVMFIIASIFGDYFLNRIVYSRKSKSILVDRLIGMFSNIIITVLVLFIVFGVFSALEGTDFDPYMTLTDGGAVIIPLLFDLNPFRDLIVNFMTDNGVTSILVTILNMVWPNFEYLSAI